MLQIFKNIFAYLVLILFLCVTFFAILSAGTTVEPLEKFLPEPIIQLLGIATLLGATMGSPYIIYRVAKRWNLPGVRIFKIILFSIGAGVTFFALLIVYALRKTTF